jgi:hypothetical protein
MEKVESQCVCITKLTFGYYADYPKNILLGVTYDGTIQDLNDNEELGTANGIG